MTDRTRNPLAAGPLAHAGQVAPSPAWLAAWRSSGVWLCASLLLASHFAVAYTSGTQSWLDLAHYAQGNERLPFQYRALTGWILRAGLHLPGLSFLAAHASHKMADRMEILCTGLAFFSALWIMRCALVAARLILQDEQMARWASLSIMMPLYVSFEALANGYRLSYAYDLPSLALFFTCLLAILRHRHASMLLLFTLATLSRETSLYLIAIFLCWTAYDGDGGRRAPWGSAARADWAVAAVMSAIWAGIRGVLKAVYAHNPLDDTAVHLHGVAHGVQVELLANLVSLANPLQWPGLLSALGWLWLPVFSFWPLVGDRRLRVAIAVTTPLAVVTMTIAGRLTEPRVFAELSLLYWLAVLAQVKALVRARSRPTQALLSMPQERSEGSCA